ncbi:response regulator [Dechloromonas sp. A34]|uniref:response regulator n=1 Tax=Dechloromonas sp. A34 TaxID=447588 RepID=UPI00224904A4|nr:response regulator [Dechloromonas sp. A34]
MRVLIVDDNASMRIMLATLLADRGHTVVGALAEGSGVMEAVRNLSPDIVCLDYQLPGRDGLDILNEINTARPEIDVLFMTASEEESIEQRAADAGAAGFLRKPFGQKQVIDEVQQVVSTRQQANAANQQSAVRQAPAPQTGGATPRKRPSAVIVDDNGSIRLLLKGLLTELGLNIVGQASNGEEAVKAAQNHQPAVLFLDVNMPGLSGLDALPRIREASPQTAVVMVTGSASRELVEKAAGLGARGYVVKPIRPAYLEAFVKKLFNQ